MKAFILLTALIVCFSCKKTNNSPVVSSLATVMTGTLTVTSSTTASVNGNVINDGGAQVEERGVCWSTATKPGIDGNHSSDGTGTGTFTGELRGLLPSTTYYARAYATNINGTAYGTDTSFTTPPPSAPVISTVAVNAVTIMSAVCTGLINSDGGAVITAAGICWGTGTAPNLAGEHTLENPANIASHITGLRAGNTYYLRAYATNSLGTAYGNELTFTTPSPLSPVVYAAGGFYSHAAIFSNLWVNENAIDITIPGAVPTTIRENAVYATATDVYTAGTVYVAGDVKATLWKNGTPVYLPGSSNGSWAQSVFVSGADVYVAGYEKIGSVTVAKLWKNAVPTSLTDGTRDAVSLAVFVAGTDVYVAGMEWNGTKNVARLWKNGIAAALTNGANNAQAAGVFVTGVDVYVAGWEENGTQAVAKVWKNGVPASLTDGANSTQAYSVFVTGADVYVTGHAANGSFKTARLWKNGTASALNTTGATDSYANCVFVSGTDVYVSGAQLSPGFDYKATIWKNGIPAYLTDGVNESWASGVFVR